MGDVIDMPQAWESKREDLHKALAAFVNVLTLVALLSSVPLNIWLWTVAL